MSTIRLISVIAFSACCLSISTRPILAEDNPLVEAQQLERQYDAVRQQIQRIPDDVKRLDEAIKRDKSSKDIQDFRRVLSDALSVLSDNGSLEALTKSYVSQLENALKVAQEDEHFSPEQRKTLVDGWNQKLSEARKKISALSIEVDPIGWTGIGLS